MLRRAAIVALVLAALPATAQASVVSRVGELIRHQPTPLGEDVLIISDDGGTAFFQGGDTLGKGAGCDMPASRVVTCPEAGAQQVIVDFGPGEDSILVSQTTGFSLPITVNPSSGTDVLLMGSERDVVFGGPGADRLLTQGGNDNVFGGDGEDLLSSGEGADFVDGGAGNDDITSTEGADSIQGGTGADRVFFGAGNDTITLDERANDGVPGQGLNLHSDVETVDGGDGSDHIVGDGNANILRGGRGVDVLEGGDGTDQLEGSADADDLRGGSNFDVVSYPEAAAQRVTLDDVADDGATGERDNVHSDVESVAAGPGNDALIGNAAANTLDGGDGNDELRGGAGVDTYLGGPGADAIFARDGLPERVDCGPGGGAATVDTVDTVLGCTTVDVSDDLVPDLDRDGVDRPPRGNDCNDRNPAIHPGAREIVNNAVDENCNGRADFDRDGDGVLARPGGRDCNDRNRRISPRRREIPGNRIDEDCDGKAAPFPLLESAVGALFVTVGDDTRFTDLLVRRARKGSTIRLVCRGPGCAWHTRTIKVKRNRRTVKLMHLVRSLVLRTGTRFEVRITKRRTIGGIVRLTMRHGAPPARRNACLFPGRKHPRRCPG